MGDRVVHFEIGARDPASLHPFYADLFGWRVTEVPGAGYAFVDTTGGEGINGGIGVSREGASWATFYVAVEDPQALLDKVESLGGRTVVPVTKVPGTITFAMFDDPDALLVGLVRRGPEGRSAAREPSAGTGAPVDWFEVLGSDATRTQAFYAELFGWRLQGGSPAYALVDTRAGERAIGGGIGAAAAEAESTRWATFYARVHDVDATLAKAERLGGARVYGPMTVGDRMKTGALRDPAGSVIGIYEQV
jgi:predicted enzyme related to lactoylglutathione lyase